MLIWNLKVSYPIMYLYLSRRELQIDLTAVFILCSIHLSTILFGPSDTRSHEKDSEQAQSERETVERCLSPSAGRGPRCSETLGKYNSFLLILCQDQSRTKCQKAGSASKGIHNQMDPVAGGMKRE